PRLVVNSNLHNDAPNAFDPPADVGSAIVLTDMDGRLVFFEAMPRAGAVDSLGTGQADWPSLVSAAGYDANRMTRVVPTADPAHHTDSVTAWSVPGRTKKAPVTLLAGWLGGKIVHLSTTSSAFGSTVDPTVLRYMGWGVRPAILFGLVFWSLVPLVGGAF